MQAVASCQSQFCAQATWLGCLISQPSAVWIVPKQSKWSANQRIHIPEALTAVLICWYSGEGSHADETVAVYLVKKARAAKQWIACDCLGADVQPPLMSVALLSDIDTYYLRRLTGTGRPEHRSDCPFFREQAKLRQLSGALPPLRAPPALNYWPLWCNH